MACSPKSSVFLNLERFSFFSGNKREQHDLEPFGLTTVDAIGLPSLIYLIYFLGCPSKSGGDFFQPWKGFVVFSTSKFCSTLGSLFNLNFCLFSLGRLFQPQSFFQPWKVFFYQPQCYILERFLSRTSKFLFNIGRLPKS